MNGSDAVDEPRADAERALALARMHADRRIELQALELILSTDVDNADSPNGEVVHRRRAIVVPDTEKYRAFRRGLHVGAGIRSWLGVPLMFGEHLFGMFALDKREADFYQAEHERIALTFAAQAAEAMAKFRN